MIVGLILLVGTTLTSSAAPKASTKVYNYQTYTYPHPVKISKDNLIVDDMSTFVRNHSLRNAVGNLSALSGNKTALRMKPEYYDPDRSAIFHTKLFDLMKQSLYATQDRLKYLQGILEKYQDDPCFRAGYIFTKLDQLVAEIRRIYSYAVKKHDYRRVDTNIGFYRHIAKKNVDITYIVEYMHSFHERNLKVLAKFYSGFENV